MLRQKVIKLVTLDATNTIISISGGLAMHYVNAAQVYGVNVASDRIHVNFYNAFKKHTTKYPNYGQTVGMSSQEWWDKVVKASFADYDLNPEVLNKICCDLYENFKTKCCWEVFPDVVPALTRLQHHGILLGVISNFDERLPLILDELNLTSFFSFVLPSRTTSYYKPLSQIFHHALSIVNIPASQAVHIGDNLDLDYKAAKQAGMNAFLLSRQPGTQDDRMKTVNSDEIVKDISELSDRILTAKHS